MTTHEIREAVLTSASAEARARSYVERRLDEVRELLGDQTPAFFIQAMPLIAPDRSWEVLSEPFEKVLRGDSRRLQFHDTYYNLAGSIAPRPTIDGLFEQDQHEQPGWEPEVHRNGYVSALFRDIQMEAVDGDNCYVVHSGYCDFFRAFCHMLKEFISIGHRMALPHGNESAQQHIADR